MSQQMVIQVVDDDPAMLDSLSFLLDSSGYTTKRHSSPQSLLDSCATLEPGCIITDVRMPEINGLQLIGRLRQSGVQHPVIVITGHADVPLAVEAMKAGVSDFLEKPFDEDTLLQAVRTALAAQHVKAGDENEAIDLRNRIASLTSREKDVFDAVVAGDSNKVAAQKLGISPRTVEIYRANVMAKMKAQSLSELVRMALRLEHM